MENHFFLKGKITGQTPNNFTILNKDYNIFHSLLFSLLFISHNFLLLYVFFFSFACSHSRSFSRLHCPHTLGFSLHQMAEWHFLLFLHLYLLFFLSHACHQFTINASQLALTFVHNIREKDNFNSSFLASYFRAFTSGNSILSYFTIPKSHFIIYTIQFYNTLSIPTFILQYNTLK